MINLIYNKAMKAIGIQIKISCVILLEILKTPTTYL